HLVIALDLLEGLLQDLGGILRIAGKEFLERARHPRRRLGKPVAPRIVAGPADDGSKRGLDLGAARAIALVMKVVGALKGMDIAAHRCSLLIAGAGLEMLRAHGHGGSQGLDGRTTKRFPGSFADEQAAFGWRCSPPSPANHRGRQFVIAQFSSSRGLTSMRLADCLAQTAHSER